jgi:hypothetical protein
MLAYQPALSALADADRLRENADLASSVLSQPELELLEQVLDVCASRNDIRSLSEHFRDGPLELPFREIETASLKWENLDQDALQAEFTGAWNKLLGLFRHVRITTLLEKSKRQDWTQEEKDEYRRLQQGETNETPG